MKKLLPLMMLLAVSVHAQYATSDATQHVLTSKSITDNANNFAQQINQFNQQLQQQQQMINTTGDPVQALGSVGGVAGLDVGANSGVTSSFRAVANAASAANSLNYTGQGLYKSIPNSVNGISVDRDMNNYKSYAAFESTFDRYMAGSEQLRTTRDQITKQIEVEQNKPAATETA
jgi:hypothetical protein